MNMTSRHFPRTNVHLLALAAVAGLTGCWEIDAPSDDFGAGGASDAMAGRGGIAGSVGNAGAAVDLAQTRGGSGASETPHSGGRDQSTGGATAVAGSASIGTNTGGFRQAGGSASTGGRAAGGATPGGALSTGGVSNVATGGRAATGGAPSTGGAHVSGAPGVAKGGAAAGGNRAVAGAAGRSIAGSAGSLGGASSNGGNAQAGSSGAPPVLEPICTDEEGAALPYDFSFGLLSEYAFELSMSCSVGGFLAPLVLVDPVDLTAVMAFVTEATDWYRAEILRCSGAASQLGSNAYGLLPASESAGLSAADFDASLMLFLSVIDRHDTQPDAVSATKKQKIKERVNAVKARAVHSVTVGLTKTLPETECVPSE